MAITWGSWNDYGSTNGGSMRIGFDITPSVVTNTSATFTATVGVYTQNERPFTSAPDSQQLNFYDDWGSLGPAYTNAEGTAPVLRHTKVYTYTYGAYYSTASPGTVNLCGEVHDGPIPFVCVAVVIPGRPPDPPDPPSSVVLTRNSDTQATLTWTRNATTAKPYNNQTIQLRRWDGATPWTDAGFASIVSASGTATSYVKSGLEANHAYQLRIRSENAGGSSAWVNSGVIFMTPAAPSAASSVMGSTGTAITTTWTDNAYNYSPTAPLTWKVQRSVSGGAFADIGTVASQAMTSFTDLTANTALTNAYRVAALAGALQSAYTTAATVPAATPPLAPTLLSPNGTSVDLVNDANFFQWTHNPGPTGTVATHFSIEYSSNAGSTWMALPGAANVASGVAGFTVPAGTLSNGVAYLWHVKTEGVVSAGFGPFSASAALTGSTRPTVTLNQPTSTTHTLSIIASWSYAQAELFPQAAWQALLYAADGVTLLEEKDGFDASSTTIFAYPAVTGTTYVVKVRAQSSVGIWSNYASVTTAYSLFPPADVTASGEYVLCTGGVLLHFAPTASILGTTVDVALITLERRTGGSDWVTLADGLLVPTDFLDTLPTTNGLNEYRITAVSATPSRAVMPILSVQGTDGQNASGDPLWAWIAYGDNFENILRVHGDLQISETTAREKTNQHFLGRAKPVALVGQATDRAVTTSGRLFFDQFCPDLIPDNCKYDSPAEGWNTAGLVSDAVCYRDYTGRRFFGTLSDVAVGEVSWPGISSVRFTVTEIDFTERYVQLVVM